MLQKFLRESSLAAKVKVGADIIVHRRSMNAADLQVIGEDGLNLPLSAEEECELEVEGLAVAAGRIVRKRDGYYFKVTRMNRED